MVPLQQPQTPMLLGLSVVKEIFFQIPELHLWHKNFLTQVKERVENWHSMGKIGDLFVASVSVCVRVHLHVCVSMCVFIHMCKCVSTCICLRMHLRYFYLQFSENKLMETYSKFINNFMQAKSNIQIAKMQLPMFAKFLEVSF